MKRKRTFQFLLAVVISLLLPLLSAYTDYYVLIEADFLSAHPKFENSDLESLFLCKKQQDFAALTAFPCAFRAADNLIEQHCCFDYQVTFPQVSFVLRC